MGPLFISATKANTNNRKTENDPVMMFFYIIVIPRPRAHFCKVVRLYLYRNILEQIYFKAKM